MRQIPEIIARLKNQKISGEEIYNEIANIDVRDLTEDERKEILKTFEEERPEEYKQLHLVVAGSYSKYF